MGRGGIRRLANACGFLEDTVESALQRTWVFVPVVALLGLVFIIRWAIVAFSVPTVGPDYGHYLIAANWYVGVDRTGEGPFDPPLVPLIIAAFGPVFGRINVLRLLGPLALASMFVAAVFFLSRFLPRWASLTAAGVFVQWQTYLEFITSGGVTNLFGIAFSLVFFRLFYQALEAPARGWSIRKDEAIASAILFLLASTHHFTTFIVGATILTWSLIYLAAGAQDRRSSLWTLGRVVGPGVALSLVYIPYYLALLATDAQSGFGRPTPLAALASGIAYAWQDTPWLWAMFVGLAGATVARFRLRTPLLPPAIALGGTPLLLIPTILASHPVRPLYFLPFPIVFLASLWLVREGQSWHLRDSVRGTRAAGRALCAVFIAGALLVLPGSGQDRQVDGIGYYHQFLSASTFEAFDWIEMNAPPNATFAVDAGTAPAFNDAWKGMATGWWLEGYANRKAIYEANPPLLPFRSKWDDTRDANRLFAGETIFEDGVLRVADSFPVDDAASPKVYTGYYGDFHELAGFAVPRLVDSAGGTDFTLVLGADARYARGLADGLGWVSGNYSGPGFIGTRRMEYDYASTTTTLTLALRLNPGAPWDSFEMTIRTPPWTQVDTQGLAQQSLVLVVPDLFGYSSEQGRIDFVASNLSLPSIVPALGKPGESGIGLRWGIVGPEVSLEATVTITVLPATGLSRHAPFMRASDQILIDHDVDFLFVTTDSGSNVQRFDRQPARFQRVFANPAVVIFRLS